MMSTVVLAGDRRAQLEARAEAKRLRRLARRSAA